MKKLTLSLLITSVLMTGSVFAGTESKSFKKEVVAVEPTCFYRDTEFQIDAFYTGIIGSRGSQLGTGSGGGLGLNYFFARYFGIGWEGSLYSNQGTASWMPVNGNFFFRYPICSLNLSPYIMVGGGADFQRGRDSLGYGNVGGGVEYRFTPNIGIFADGRYYYGGSGNVANIRSGVKFAF